MLIIGTLVITQVVSIFAMDWALADGDDERNQELVVIATLVASLFIFAPLSELQI